ncbi:MAG: type I glyceraldehyde-3-phosphate dehydrogenase [Deltaproteobacteria bacterium]|nr:type I glyceraldehyde-3-phosphate dehydrogenase [Deltaproteobacteria bacterium]
MSIRVAINGFGRIGRNVLRSLPSNSKIEIVAVNDLTDTKTLAHLLKYDSVHGTLPLPVEASADSIVVGDKTIKVLSERNPQNLPWAKLGIDVVYECTGIFRTKKEVSAHIDAGAKKVLISAPSPDPDITVVYGVNHENYEPQTHQVISNGSCTTNCLAPVAKIVLDNFGIERGMMTTIHSYTNDQQILDLPHADLRRARAAALSMIPTTTGAAKAMSLVIPELKGKLDGLAIRVPTPNVSLVDFVCETQKDVTLAEVKSALVEAARGKLSQILAISDKPLVSCDFNGCPKSAIVDIESTMVIGGRMVKILAWYDNEIGFSHRMNDVAAILFG